MILKSSRGGDVLGKKAEKQSVRLAKGKRCVSGFTRYFSAISAAPREQK
jgi:hypothetical protein